MSGGIDWRKDLLKQKSLFQVWRETRRFGQSKFNAVTLSIVIFLLSVYSIWAFCGAGEIVTTNSLASLVVSWADDIYAFTLGILGFLITGFAVFTALTNVRLFARLAQVRYDESHISLLQFIFFNFVNTFTMFVCLLSLSLVIKLGYGAPGAPFQVLGYKILEQWPQVGVPFNLIAMTFIGACLTRAVLILKSFIWNLYQAVLLSIVAGEEAHPKPDCVS